MKKARVLRELTVESEQLTRLKLEECDSIAWEALTSLAAKQSNCKLTLRECVQIDKGRAEIDKNGTTALLWAAGRGHLPVVQWLLQAGGARIDEKDNDGRTALLWAANQGHLPVVQWLLQAGGARIDEKSNLGNTALLLAAIRVIYRWCSGYCRQVARASMRKIIWAIPRCCWQPGGSFTGGAVVIAGRWRAHR